MWKKLFFIIAVSVIMVPPLQAAELDEVYVRLFTVQLQQAKKGDAQGQLHVGEMYEKGLGTEPDLKQAHKWYSKAAAQNNKMAKEKLAAWDRVKKDFADNNEDVAAAIAKADRERVARRAEAERKARERAARAERERTAKSRARVKKPKAAPKPKPKVTPAPQAKKAGKPKKAKSKEKGESFSADPCKSPAAKFMSTCR